jgi:hypothetical protein
VLKKLNTEISEFQNTKTKLLATISNVDQLPFIILENKLSERAYGELDDTLKPFYKEEVKSVWRGGSGYEAPKEYEVKTHVIDPESLRQGIERLTECANTPVEEAQNGTNKKRTNKKKKNE